MDLGTSLERAEVLHYMPSPSAAECSMTAATRCLNIGVAECSVPGTAPESHASQEFLRPLQMLHSLWHSRHHLASSATMRLSDAEALTTVPCCCISTGLKTHLQV